MDIGTAEPKLMNRKGIKHHCMDLVELSKKFDVSMFIEAAQKAIESIVSSRKNVVVVGGSGFSLKSFYHPVIDGIKIRRNVSDLVNSIYANSGFDGLITMIISAKDGICPPIDMTNPRRVMSAVKRCLACGKTFDEVQSNFASLDSPFEYRKHTVLLERDREDLKPLIWEGAKNAIGYRETINWIRSSTTEDALIDEISQNISKLVKKQKKHGSKNRFP
jgi:tRNA dimethylallyltransferase